MSSTYVQEGSFAHTFLNIEDGLKIILLVKSLYHIVLPNCRILVFFKIDFLSFYTLKCESDYFLEILLIHETFLVLLLRDYFYTFPS